MKWICNIHDTYSKNEIYFQIPAIKTRLDVYFTFILNTQKSKDQLSSPRLIFSKSNLYRAICSPCLRMNEF